MTSDEADEILERITQQLEPLALAAAADPDLARLASNRLAILNALFIHVAYNSNPVALAGLSYNAQVQLDRLSRHEIHQSVYDERVGEFVQ